MDEHVLVVDDDPDIRDSLRRGLCVSSWPQARRWNLIRLIPEGGTPRFLGWLEIVAGPRRAWRATAAASDAPRHVTRKRILGEPAASTKACVPGWSVL